MCLGEIHESLLGSERNNIDRPWLPVVAEGFSRVTTGIKITPWPGSGSVMF
jgi:hypothetical protein